MQKKREYRWATVEICRNCKGCGFLKDERNGVGRFVVCVKTPCPVCDGHGRVWKVNEGTVTIEPFDGQSE